MVDLLLKNKGFILIELMISLGVVLLSATVSFTVLNAKGTAELIIQDSIEKIQSEIELELRVSTHCGISTEENDAEC